MDLKKLVFNIFKDSALDIDIFRSIIKEKYNIENYYEIYVDIINYQIEKYGCQLYDFKEYSTRKVK